MIPQNFYWSSNLRHLRKRMKLSQESLAEKLDIGRSSLAMHESGKVKNPAIEDLVKFSEVFHIAIDTLLKVDLTKLGELKLRELESGSDVYLTGSNIRVLAITVDKNNRENAEYVPLKSKAGYLKGYNDPEFLSTLDKFSLPHLSDKKTYRIFPTEGDSMFPLPQDCMVVGEYVANMKELDKKLCIVIMHTEQTLLFKEVSYLKNEHANILLHSLNTSYADQKVLATDIKEIWAYHSHITNVMPGANPLQEVLMGIDDIKRQLAKKH